MHALSLLLDMYTNINEITWHLRGDMAMMMGNSALKIQGGFAAGGKKADILKPNLLRSRCRLSYGFVGPRH
jgi:hypothetical protein